MPNYICLLLKISLMVECYAGLIPDFSESAACTFAHCVYNSYHAASHARHKLSTTQYNK